DRGVTTPIERVLSPLMRAESRLQLGPQLSGVGDHDASLSRFSASRPTPQTGVQTRVLTGATGTSDDEASPRSPLQRKEMPCPSPRARPTRRSARSTSILRRRP